MSLFQDLATIDIPACYKFLLEPSRFIVIYGGRNAGKDWNLIRADLLLGMLYNPTYTEVEIKAICESFKTDYKIKTGLIETSLRKPHRFLYCREVMESIKRSVHTTIKDQIYSLGLQGWWQIKDDSIICKNGSEFRFAGLYRDPHNIKSAEGVTLARILEAENVSDDSYKYFIPTIRTPGSQILIHFNTRYEDDPTYQRWVVNPPVGTLVKKINSHDLEGYLDEFGNEKYFSKEAKENRENDYKLRRWEYDNVWLGEPLAAGRKIYPMFKEEVHCRYFDRKMLKEKANFFMAQDPAQKYYPAALFGCTFPDEMGTIIKYIYAEYPSYDDFNDYYAKLRTTMIYSGTIAEMANMFFLRGGCREFGWEWRAAFIDTRFASGVGGKSVFSNSTEGIVGEYLKQENGAICFECPEVTIIDKQRNCIIEDLKYNIVSPIGPYNHPNLYIDPSCTNLIQSLRNHRLEEKSEAESAKYKDFSDALRIWYAGVEGYEYQIPGKNAMKIKYQKRRKYASSDSWMGS
jgi:hypothetical protein